MEVTDKLELASRFVNGTNSHIFLTGKAGTGKTTFLRNISASTHKKHVIVAPTGIAALNAQGVTIHSQFLMPFGCFLPLDELPFNFQQNANFYTRKTLSTRHPLNSPRIQILRNIDLLIIDEVSMLRADLLDAIDYRMRMVKRNYRQPFGGIQVLFIGDLYQLPPIVNDNEWKIMSEYYESPHFFNSKALKESGFVFLELDKIFRQQDQIFISLLNNFRNNIVTRVDMELLNTCYKPHQEIPEEVITITTHNHKADEINNSSLRKIGSKPRLFHAKINGEFQESMYPVPEVLELKVGARVMFVKNGMSEVKYINGQLATIREINEDDEVKVSIDGKKELFTLEAEIWPNKRYSINRETREMDEEVLGTFTQFPIRLAWAVTVHKSQGLTFENAIIDVGRAFAPGQVYVALSRLTSLEGLILRTRIDSSIVSTDQYVVSFSARNEQQPPLPTLLKENQSHFLSNLLEKAFDFAEFEKQLDVVIGKNELINDFEDQEMRMALRQILIKISSERENTNRFSQQLRERLNRRMEAELLERLEKGTVYYENKILEWLFDLLKHLEEVRSFAKTKTYQNALEETDAMLMSKLEEVQSTKHIVQCILENRDINRQNDQVIKRRTQRADILEAVEKTILSNPKKVSNKTGRAKKSKSTSLKKEKGKTFLETYRLLKEGNSIEHIAHVRNLAPGTIESHLVKGIENGQLDIEDCMDSELYRSIRKLIESNSNSSLNELMNLSNRKFTFGKLKIVISYLKKLTEQSPQSPY